MTSSTKPPTIAAKVSLVTGILVMGLGAAFGYVAVENWRQVRALPHLAHSTAVAKPDESERVRWIPTSIFGGFSLLILLVGTRDVVLALRLWADRRWLAVQGIRVLGVNPRIERTQRGNTGKMMSTRPYLIVVLWRDPHDGRMREFTSDLILIDPQPSMVERHTLEVLIDPDAPQRYWVDTSFLPPMRSGIVGFN